MRNVSRLVFVFLIFCQGYAAGGIEYLEDYSSLSDEELYDEVQRRIFSYFIEEANPENGLVKDRAHNFNTPPNRDDIVSCASSGMGIAALCIGHKRGGINYDEAYERVVRVLESYYNARESDSLNPDGLVHYKGFFYHFTDMEGNRVWDSELSTIDTAILVSAALFAGEYFSDHGDDYPKELAEGIYERIDWKWMTNNNPGGILEWGWTPEGNFSEGLIGGFSEGILAYILGAGAPSESKRLDRRGWKNMYRPIESTKSLEYIFEKSLFTHQYPLLFIDFSGRRDDFACYTSNVYRATIHQRRYAHNRREEYDTYSKYSWGIGAADSLDPGGYYAYGLYDNDGTVALTNLAAAAHELPGAVADSLRYIYRNHSGDLWGKYGFSDSYNTEPSVVRRGSIWRSDDVVGVQQGAVLLAIENMRSGLVKDKVSRTDYIQNAFKRLGFNENRESTSPDRIGGFRVRLSGSRAYLSWRAPLKENEYVYFDDGLYDIRFSTVSSIDDPRHAPDHYLDYDILFSTSSWSKNPFDIVIDLKDYDTDLSSWPDETRFWIRASDGYFNWSEFSEAEQIEEDFIRTRIEACTDKVFIHSAINEEITLTLVNCKFDDLSKNDIRLKGDFREVKVESLDLLSEKEAKVEIAGEIKKDKGSGVLIIEEGGLLSSDSVLFEIEVTDNLLKNPSFEAGSRAGGTALGWEDSDSAQTEEWASRTGKWGYGFLGDLGDSARVKQRVNIFEGKRYEFSFWARRDDGNLKGDFFIMMDWLDENGDLIHVTSKTFTLCTDWKRKSISDVSPEGSREVRVSFGSEYFSISGQFCSVMFDDARLESRGNDSDQKIELQLPRTNRTFFSSQDKF